MSCKRSQELLATDEIEIRELVRADKAPIPEAAALALVRQARRLIVAKGKQTTTIDVARERPDDATLRALADKGGVAGIIFWPYLRTDTQPMAIDVIRHIEHAVKVCGEDHVGIGTDSGVAPVERTPEFEKDNREWVAGAVEDGVFERGRQPDLYTFIPDLNRADRFDVLAAMLSKRGHPDARIEKILGGNFARVMGEVWG